jgi:hypothetical protein
MVPIAIQHMLKFVAPDNHNGFGATRTRSSDPWKHRHVVLDKLIDFRGPEAIAVGVVPNPNI